MASENEPDFPGFSRDATVEAVRSFYHLVTSFHIPREALKEPPKEGWPKLTREFLAPLKKTDTVYDLLAHLPYLNWDWARDGLEIDYEMCAVDYVGSGAQKTLERGKRGNMIDPDPDMALLPPSVVSLACTPGHRNGYWLLLDTETGLITWYFNQGYTDMNYWAQRRMFPDSPGEYWNMSAVGIKQEDRWRGQSTWPVVEYFELLKEQYRKLEIVRYSSFAPQESKPSADIMMKVPIRSTKVYCHIFEDEEVDPDVESLREIYRDHGWPEKDFESQRETCMAAIDDYAEDNL
ncbi:MAG: hypothetical protein M1833_006088 [Piccolia ochrophora]|nr:MAG: hypothetical protein M1833_006088 [Piccolia ochrophora]